MHYTTSLLMQLLAWLTKQEFWFGLLDPFMGLNIWNIQKQQTLGFITLLIGVLSLTFSVWGSWAHHWLGSSLTKLLIYSRKPTLETSLLIQKNRQYLLFNHYLLGFPTSTGRYGSLLITLYDKDERFMELRSHQLTDRSQIQLSLKKMKKLKMLAFIFA